MPQFSDALGSHSVFAPLAACEVYTQILGAVDHRPGESGVALPFAGGLLAVLAVGHERCFVSAHYQRMLMGPSYELLVNN